MASNPAYTSTTLNLSDQCIRLVEILDGPSEAPISCIFRAYPLATCPTYTALSYTWGSLHGLHKIYLNGKRFCIRDNLYHFLHEMRHLKRWKYFWIDAICIDQANTAERNHQVRMMREIYSKVRCTSTHQFCILAQGWFSVAYFGSHKATTVAIWLGQAGNGSDIAMDYINRSTGNEISSAETPSRHQAVLALCRRAYWKRVWIVQEVALASELFVLCGQKSCHWLLFLGLFNDLIRRMRKTRSRNKRLRSYRRSMLTSPAHRIFLHKRAWEIPNGTQPWLGPPSLGSLLRKYYDMEATDTRDKVYGFLGLVEDSHVLPDYSMTLLEVYGQVLDVEIQWGPLILKRWDRNHEQNKLRVSIFAMQLRVALQLPHEGEDPLVDSETLRVTSMNGFVDLM